MSAGRYTSRVFVCGEAIKTKLDAATLPAHPVTSETPSVSFGDADPDDGYEAVVVSLNVEKTATEWRRVSPPGRDEQIVFDVTARSYVPCGYTSAQVWDRLEALSAQIEGIVFDTSAEEIIGLGFDGEVQVARVVGVAPDVFPTDQGWMGSVVVSFSCLAQI